MIILASASPRRQALMKQIVDDYKVIVADIDETSSYSLSPLEAVLDIAQRKGNKVKMDNPNDIVLSADTIVVYNNQIIGKPKDKDDAKRILKALSNHKHEVITAFCIFYKDKVIEKYVTSEVYFNNLSDDLINRYVDSLSPLDKAGAYGVQDNDKYPIVNKVIGSIDNVIGFPVKEIKEELSKII